MPALRADLIDCYVFRRSTSGVEFLMLQRRPDDELGGTWQAVHGKVEPGESAVQAAIRELREEAGLTPVGFWQIDHVNTFYVARVDAIFLCTCFAAEVPPDAVVRLNEEHVDSRWVSAADAPRTFMWPGQRQAIREVLDDIIAASPAEPFLRIPFA